MQTILLMGILIGFAALGIQLTMLFAQQRRMQAAADAAVVAAARPGLTADQSTTEAVALAGTYGFRNGENTAKVTFTSPPTVGSYGAGAGEVRIERTFQPGLLSLFSKAPIKITVSSIAAQQSLSAGCLLALNSTAEKSVFLGPGASVINASCEMAVNSAFLKTTTSGALYVSNNGNILGPMYVVGGVYIQNNTNLFGTPQVINSGIPVNDPYKLVKLPNSSGNCKSGVVNGTQTLDPGYYCNGITVSNNSTLTLRGPGVYFIDGNFSIGGRSTITSTGGVTIFLNTASSFTVANRSTIRLTAPLSGDTAGLVFMSPLRTATPAPIFDIGNNSIFTIEGAVYLPGWTINISGQVDTSGANCTQLIADKIQFLANLTIKADCGGTAVKPIGRSQPVLIQ